MANQRVSEKKEGKRERVPFGGFRTKLQVREKLAGYVLRWFNDQDGRLEDAQNAGYVFVMQDEVTSVGEHALHEGNSDLNGRVSKVVSKGRDVPIRAFLMKIKKEWYDEDQKAKEAVNQRVDEALRSNKPSGSSVENSYIPRKG